MATVKLLGRIEPSGALKVDFTGIPSVLWQSVNDNKTYKLTWTIVGSVVDLTCEMNAWDNRSFSELHKRACDTVLASANLVGFCFGVGLHVFFDTFVNERGESSPVRLHDQYLEKYCTAYAKTDPNKVLQVVMSDADLMLTLNDLCAALTSYHAPLICCGRAIDGIRHLIAPGVKAEKAWPLVHEKLRVSEAYQKWVTKESAKPRHAERAYAPPATVEKALVRSWTIMDRYLHFRLLGGQDPLPEKDFQVLLDA